MDSSKAGLLKAGQAAHLVLAHFNFVKPEPSNQLREQTGWTRRLHLQLDTNLHLQKILLLWTMPAPQQQQTLCPFNSRWFLLAIPPTWLWVPLSFSFSTHWVHPAWKSYSHRSYSSSRYSFKNLDIFFTFGSMISLSTMTLNWLTPSLKTISGSPIFGLKRSLYNCLTEMLHNSLFFLSICLWSSGVGSGQHQIVSHLIGETTTQGWAFTHSAILALSS